MTIQASCHGFADYICHYIVCAQATEILAVIFVGTPCIIFSFVNLFEAMFLLFEVMFEAIHSKCKLLRFIQVKVQYSKYITL